MPRVEVYCIGFGAKSYASRDGGWGCFVVVEGVGVLTMVGGNCRTDWMSG